MEGNLVGSDAKNIKAETTFRWLPGGFFLEQHVQLDFMGCLEPVTGPLPYRWEVAGDAVTITVSDGPLHATFTDSWREDGTFSGGWRPNPGADENVNVPYDIGGHRLA
jgi:hypothetical protein